MVLDQEAAATRAFAAGKLLGAVDRRLGSATAASRYRRDPVDLHAAATRRWTMFVHTPPPAPASCLRALPRSPSGVPATIALDAGCALVVFTPGGNARLRPRPPMPETVGAQLSPGDGVTFRDGHVVRVRYGHVDWRSYRTFRPGTQRGTFTTISTASASGASMAYVVSRWWGTPRMEHRLVFVTTGAGPERRLPTTAYPLGWSLRGLVTADASWRR
ncbi:MAG: hypothetical protein QOJ47_441, partial [Gaiellales bacterium]|nr:hypothetical protein [Gaiellales bacterium]